MSKCGSVVFRRRDSQQEVLKRDYAVLELAQPLEIRYLPQPRSAAPQVGEPVLIIGNSAGLPTKATWGTVTNADALELGYFDFTGDVFHGGSGSGVYDTAGALLGVHARGGYDYVVSPEGCVRSRVVPEYDAGISEQASAIAGVMQDLCEVNPHLELCASYRGTDQDRLRTMEVRNHTTVLDPARASRVLDAPDGLDAELNDAALPVTTDAGEAPQHNPWSESGCHVSTGLPTPSKHPLFYWFGFLAGVSSVSRRWFRRPNASPHSLPLFRQGP